MVPILQMRKQRIRGNSIPLSLPPLQPPEIYPFSQACLKCHLFSEPPQPLPLFSLLELRLEAADLRMPSFPGGLAVASHQAWLSPKEPAHDARDSDGPPSIFSTSKECSGPRSSSCPNHITGTFSRPQHLPPASSHSPPICRHPSTTALYACQLLKMLSVYGCSRQPLKQVGWMMVVVILMP